MIETSNPFLRALLSASGDCIKILDLEGKLRFMSEGGQTVMEVDDFSKLEGCPWPDFWLGSENEKARNAVNEAKAGRTAQFFGFANTARGNPRWWKVVVAPINGSDGKPAQLLSVSTDITPQHKFERLHRESEESFSIVANSIPQMVWITDEAGTVNWYNRRWYEYTGTVFNSDNFSGRDWKKFYHPDHIEKIIRRHKQALATGEPWEMTFPIRGVDGNYRWFLTRAIPIRGGDGKISRWLGTNTDVTEQHTADEQKRILMEEMQHRVKNTLAVVQAIAVQTFRDDSRSTEKSNFSLRLVALGRAHDILLEQNWISADVATLVKRAVGVFTGDDGGRVDTGGPTLELAPRPALALAMLMHELGSNATKYGALSNEQGRIAIRWDCTGANSERKFVFNWCESGGPKVSKPARKGLGTRLVQHGLGAEFGGKAMLDFSPDGVTYTLEAPLSAIKEQTVLTPS